MCVMSTPLAARTRSSTRWPVVPTPDVAQRTRPGLAFAGMTADLRASERATAELGINPGDAIRL
jgi:hypothetical protein